MSGTITHKWNGSILTITSDSGTSSVDLRGEKGDTGIRGPQGPAGCAINDVSLIDKTLTIENYAADAKTVGDKLEQISNEIVASQAASTIINSATGNTVVIKDSSENALKGLTLYGKTEQFTTPTLDAPSELVSTGASGSIGVEVLGKNLVNVEPFTLTKPENRTKDMRWDKPLPPGTYTMRFRISNVANSKVLGIQVIWTGNGLYIVDERINLTNGINTITFDAPNGFNRFYFWLQSSEPDGATATVSDIQVEAGTAATEYEPYKEPQTLTVATPDGLNGIGDVRDYIDFARGVYVKRVGEYTFTGNETWSLNSNGSLQAIISAVKDEMINSQIGLCEFAKYVYAYASDGMFIFRTQGMGFSIAVIGAALVSSASLTIDNIGQKIAEKKVLYELENPVETPLTEEQLNAFKALYSNKSTTTITTDSIGEVKVDYVADTKLYIDNRLNAITQAIISLGGNI
jgi:hypothetical protein